MMDETRLNEKVELPGEGPSGGTVIRREYKSRLLTTLLSSEEYRDQLLNIYNVLNGTDYADSSLIKINTIDDAIYLGMHNDVSFLLGSVVSVWEHQSTYNPNMPIRILEYLAQLYAKYLKLAEVANIFGVKIVSLPSPKLVVLYNGMRETESDDFYLRLSDAFEDDDSDVEVRVRVLNINWGHNKDLLEASPLLSEYAWFVDFVRRHEPKLGLTAAVNLAIERMPKECPTLVTLNFYTGRRAEVLEMLLQDWTYERGLELSYKDGEGHGIEIGRDQGIEIGRGREARTLQSLVDEGILTEDDAARRMGEDVASFRRLVAGAC